VIPFDTRARESVIKNQTKSTFGLITNNILPTVSVPTADSAPVTPLGLASGVSMNRSLPPPKRDHSMISEHAVDKSDLTEYILGDAKRVCP